MKTVSRQQESRGYEQWAKIHNLKLAAKTMNFLTEHKIEQYADLVSRIEEVNAENEKTADALKSVEKASCRHGGADEARYHLPKDKTSL